MTTAVRQATAPLHRTSGSIVVGAFTGVVVLLLAMHQPSALRIAFPALGFSVGFWLYWREGFPAYLAFAWAFWFVTPGLRRMVDFQAGGWDPQNPMSLAPFLVSGIAVISVARHFHELRRQHLAAWMAILFAVTYGYFAGVLVMGPLAATHALLSWMVPLLFGLAIALEWRHYPACAWSVSQLFFWGGLLLAVYAIVQFVNPPPWDRMWVNSSEMRSIGQALPFQIRVFSLVNAPLALATLLAAALFVGLSRRGTWRIAALAIMVIALLLTLVRSVWLACALGAIVYLVRMPRRAVYRVVVAGCIAAAAIIAVPTILPRDVAEPIVEMVSNRFATFGNLQHDVSYNERASFIDQVGTVVMDRPFGHGLGSTGVSSQLAEPDAGIRDFDSGILAALYTLGWFAGGLLLVSTLYLTVAGLSRREGPGDMSAAAARAIMVAAVVLSLGGNVFEGINAAVLWGFAGLLAAAQQWHRVMDPVVRPAR